MLKRLISTLQRAKHQKDFWVEILFLISPQKYDWCKDCNCWCIENCNIQGTVIILLNTYISIMISHQRRCSLVLVYLHKISVYCHKIGISWQLNWLPYCIFLTWNVVYFQPFLLLHWYKQPHWLQNRFEGGQRNCQGRCPGPGGREFLWVP